MEGEAAALVEILRPEMPPRGAMSVSDGAPDDPLEWSDLAVTGDAEEALEYPEGTSDEFEAFTTGDGMDGSLPVE